MSDVDYKALKKGGMMRQREAGLFSVRLHVVAGRLSTFQLEAIREAADRFGRGRIHLTSRQGVEIPDVPAASLAALKEFLAPSAIGVGVCGPTVRTVTACQGCTICPSGVIDSPALAQAVDGELYGKPVPHKFKVGISGCANNCIKAEENDVGIKGWVTPRWTGGVCSACRICEAVCPVGAVRIPADGSGAGAIDLAACIGCGDCIAVCPAGSMEEADRGCRIYVGGKFGRLPSLGRPIEGLFRTADEVLAAVGAVVSFFRAEGRPKERFGDTLRRTGQAALEDALAERRIVPS